MDIKRAVITAAGNNQRRLPLQTLVDRDGVTKPVLRVISEEILSAGVEEICIIISPGDEAEYRLAAGPCAKRMQFVEQPKPLGYGHAVYCAHNFTGTDPFLLLVGDHLYLSREQRSCMRQLIEAAQVESCAVSAVQATHESKLPYYGVVAGHLQPGRARLYQVETVMEKPTPTQAEQELIVPGLRAGHYLCFFGMHVLTAGAMKLLGELLAGHDAAKGALHLSSALALLANQERYLACELDGRRYDIGNKYGLLSAQLALSLEGKDREEVLAMLVEVLAQRGR